MDDHAGTCSPYSVNELKQWPNQVWCNLDQDIIDANGVKDSPHVFVQRGQRGILSTPCELTGTVYDLLCVIGSLKYSVLYRIIIRSVDINSIIFVS